MCCGTLAKQRLCFMPERRASDVSHVCRDVSVCEMPLSRGVCHSASPCHASSGLFPQAPGCCQAVASKSKARPVSGISWRKRNRSFPAEWACCSALPVCVEFRWGGERVLLVAGGFLTTINLGVWAINIMFPPITVCLPGKCSGHTVCKAEFTRIEGDFSGRGSFVWSPNNLLWF